MALDMLKEIAAIRDEYAANPRTGAFNALIVGTSGSGKTYLARTCRTPVLIDMFDPGGEKSLREYIAKGDIVADTRWSYDDPFAPSAYMKWKAEFQRRIKEGFFNHFGTYIIDSATTWSSAMMNEILRQGNRAGQRPDFTKDYMAQKIELRARLGQCLALPCDFILTGHLNPEKDEVTGKVSYQFMTTGKGSIEIPLLFDEYYVTDAQQTSQGVTYRLLTQSTGTYVARSRLSAGGKLSTYEEADIKKILKKTGFNTEDKPKL